MSEATESIQSWQIFSGLFICFWLTSAYFDHFMFTGVFCIVFGVAAEIVTKTMYAGGTNEKTDENISNRSNETHRRNETCLANAEAAFDEEDDDVPPPLPDKDYETGKIDTLAEKLQALVDASATEEDNATPENDSAEENAAPVAVARQYNRTVSDEFNQNTSTVNCNLMQEMNNRHTSIEEEPVEQVASDEEEDQDRSVILDEKKVYAPDSSDDDDDEDEDEDFVSREVNFDESESEDGDFEDYISNTNIEGTPKISQSPIGATEDTMESKKTNNEIVNEERYDSKIKTENKISDTDLHLSEPAKEASATDILAEVK